jgi:hypothetical protein
MIKIKIKIGLSDKLMLTPIRHKTAQAVNVFNLGRFADQVKSNDENLLIFSDNLL